MSISHTRIFYTILMEDDFSAFEEGGEQDIDCSDPLSSMLSPDCRVQNKYGDLARGDNGLPACVRRLRRLQAALLPLPASTRQGILVPVSACQTMIYFSLLVDGGNDKFSAATQQRVTLGVGLEWERGVVTGIVIRHEMRHLDPDTFLTLVMYSSRKECHVQIQSVVVSVNEIQEGQLTSCEHAEGDDVVSVNCQPTSPSPEIGLESTAPAHSRSVRFSDMLRVVLVPVVSSYEQRCASAPGDSDCFYSRQDFHRFSRQRDFEVADIMREEGLTHDEALQALYLPDDAVGQLCTELNYHISFEKPEEEEKSPHNESGDEQHIDSNEDSCEDNTQHDHDELSIYRGNFSAGAEGRRFRREWLSDSDDDTIESDKRHDSASDSPGVRDKKSMRLGQGGGPQRGRLRGCSFSACGISELGCRDKGRDRSASATVCGGKHGVVGVSSSWRPELPDESLLDARRYVHFQQRHNEYLNAESVRALYGEDSTRQGQGLARSVAALVRPFRSISADGRLQSCAEDLASTESLDAWYPGKYLQQVRDGAVGAGGHEAEYNLSSSRFVDRSSSSCSTSSKESMSSLGSTSEFDDESDGWYFGKLMKRVMTKTDPSNKKDGGDGWFFGKYILKAMTPLPAPSPRARQIFNAHDSLRLTGEALSDLQETVNSHKAVELDSSSSDSDSDSDDGFIGIRRKRSRKVLLPRVSAAGWILGRTIAREGLSRSPVNVEVTVLRCHGLKSGSIFPPYSPVSFVEVSVGDNAPIRTNEASRSSNPIFQEKLMSFPLSVLDVLGEYLHFTVYERFVSGQKAVLGYAQLSLSAIPVCDGSDQTTTVTLQLVSKVSADPVGKGLYQPLSASTGAGARSDWQRATFHEPGGQKSYDQIKREAHKASTSSILGTHSAARRLTAADGGAVAPPPIIEVSICKIDEAMFSVLKQLRDEDAVCERQYAAGAALGGASTVWLDEEPYFSQDL